MAGVGPSNSDNPLGGTTAKHPSAVALPVLAAPSTGKEKNTIRMELIPVACWKVNDIRFDFGSSFLLPPSKGEFAELEGLRRDHPGSLLSLFGHADAVSTDSFNKSLSDHRAESVYAVLVREPARWEKLHSATGSSEGWGIAAIQHMLTALGEDPGPVTRSMNPTTKAAVESFQRKNPPLAVDGDPGKNTRAKLFPAYMAFLWPNPLVKTDFLAQGVDAGGKGDFQGCSEFNQVMVFSAAEKAEFDKPEKRDERNDLNGVNRRVVGLLFRAGTSVPPDKWPCPRSGEGTDGCRKRFWSDGEKRRSNQAAHREFGTAKDTFACRFYHRLVIHSPCEGVEPVPEILDLKLIDVWDHFAPGAEQIEFKYALKGFSGKTVKIEVSSSKYAGGLIFTRELTAAERADGTRAILWDGKAAAGALKDKFIYPLLSPFTVRLLGDATHKDEKSFRVLVHSIELKLGDFEKGIFDDGANGNKGQRQRLKALSYFLGDVTKDDASEAEFKKAVEWFQSEHDPGAAAKGVVGASTESALKARLPHIIEGGVLPVGGKKKLFVSGAFFYRRTSDLSANPAVVPKPAVGPVPPPTTGTHHRYLAERDFWADGVRLPIYAKIYLKKKDDTKADSPDAVGPQPVLFEWIDTAEDTSALAGKQLDYVTKALDYFTATTNPKGDNCHMSRGGKRGDDIVKVFPESNDPTKFPYVVKKGAVRNWAVVSTADKGMAGVIFQPGRMGGDNYKLHAYLHTQKDLDTNGEKAAAPEVEAKSGELNVWRPVRVNQYLHKANAVINEINIGTVNTETAKASMEFTGNLAKTDIAEAVWIAKVTSALSGDADFATIGAINYASVNTIDFKSFAAYQTAGGALGAAAYATLCRGKVWPWVELIIKEFAKDQFHGMTIIRAGYAHENYVTNSGAGFANGVCYIWWPKADYDGLGYVVEKYALHELGHCLYLRHHYTAAATGPVATWPASDNPDDHDADDAACAMSYYQTAWHLCGKCILKLRGWDEAQLSRDDDGNKKP